MNLQRSAITLVCVASAATAHAQNTASERLAVEHHTRVNVHTRGGEWLVGESGGDKGDLAQPKSDAQISEKFLGTAEAFLGPQQAQAMLEHQWCLEQAASVAAIPGGFVKH